MTQTKTVKLAQIAPNPWNAHGMTPEEFQALRDSIREKGVWRPIVVIEMDAPDNQTPDLDPDVPYRIVDGEHLYRALVAERLEKGGADEALVFVYGQNSAVPVHVQMEIGQTINHGLRGSKEDLEKTGRIVEELTKFRSVEEVARRTGQSVTFLEAARRIVEPGPARRPLERTGGSERKGQTVPLVFEDNESLARYNAAIKGWEAKVDPQGEMTPGRRRIAAVLDALEGGVL